MRKLKLFFAALALLVGGSNSVWAQKDVTSQYITNATLSNGTTGWTAVNFNTPVNALHRNVNNDKIYSNATTGYATEAYAGWNGLEKTSFGLTQNITLPAGHYRLVNYSFFRQGEAANTDANKSLAILKAGNESVAISTLGSITAAGYANSQWEGAGCFDSKMYRNTLDFTIDANNTSIEIGITGTFDVMRSWCIVGQFELIDLDTEATMDAPFDVTGYITNPGFEYRDMSGWIQNPSGSFGVQNNDQGFKTAWFYAEKWQSSNDGALSERSFSQTLKDLPAGYYKLTANLGGNGTYIDLNGKTANWEADKDYTVGYVLAKNEDLTITAGKTAEGTANWIHFDDFRLQFCGDVAAALTTLCAKVDDYQNVLPTNAYQALAAQVAGYNKNYSDVDELLAAINAVQALYDAADLYIQLSTEYATASAFLDTPMNGDILTALQSAMNNAKGITLESTAAETIAAITALETATANATTSIANYIEAKAILDAANGYDAGQSYYTSTETYTAINNAYDDRTLTAVTAEQKTAASEALARVDAWKRMKAYADALVVVANDKPDANSTLETAISEQNVAAEDATTATDIETATATLKDAMVTYAGAANPVGDGAQFDLTFMLTNPDVTNFWDGTWWIQPEGWYKDQTDGNFQVMSNGEVNAEDGVHKVFTEYYYLNTNDNTTYDNGKFNIFTKATLPAGTYTMNCYAFAKEQNYSSGAANPQVYFYANDTQGSLVNSNKLTEQSISFVNDANQEVKIGLKPLAGNTYNWMGIGYVQLFKVPAQSYEVDETKAWDNTVSGAGDVILNRTIKEGVNTLVLPFSMTQAEVEEQFGEGSKVYTLKSYDAEKENLSFESHDGISANQPCLLQATVAGDSYELVDRTIVAGTPEIEVTDAKMVGTYDAWIYAPQGSYIISGGKIYNVNSEVTLKNTRAYIELTNGDSSRALTFSLDDETTGIATLKNGELKIETGAIFDLSGRRVNAPAKGVYIINGKKVVK